MISIHCVKLVDSTSHNWKTAGYQLGCWKVIRIETNSPENYLLHQPLGILGILNQPVLRIKLTWRVFWNGLNYSLTNIQISRSSASSQNEAEMTLSPTEKRQFFQFRNGHQSQVWEVRQELPVEHDIWDMSIWISNAVPIFCVELPLILLTSTSLTMCVVSSLKTNSVDFQQCRVCFSHQHEHHQLYASTIEKQHVPLLHPPCAEIANADGFAAANGLFFRTTV